MPRELFRELITVHSGQPDIGDENVKSVLLADLQGFLGGCAGMNRMPHHLKHQAEAFTHAVIVFHQQDSRRRGLDTFARQQGFGDNRFRIAWEADAELSPLPRLAENLQKAVILVNDSIDRCQPQPVPIHAFGGVEGFKNMRQVFGRDANSLVAHAQAFVFPGRGILGERRSWLFNPMGIGTDGNGAAIWHRVACIQHEVHQNLFQLGGVYQHNLGRRVKLEFNLHPLAQHMLKEWEHFLNDLIDVGWAWLGELFARESK
ncbi:hypothetical protein HRbin14_01821 [bacterium HR14]|nr:hypothetical protein HRbin14_01821 [bacterium HR14]